MADGECSGKFGLVDSNEKFHYINVTTGSIDKTIEIPENGQLCKAGRRDSEQLRMNNALIGIFKKNLHKYEIDIIFMEAFYVCC